MYRKVGLLPVYLRRSEFAFPEAPALPSACPPTRAIKLVSTPPGAMPCRNFSTPHASPKMICGQRDGLEWQTWQTGGWQGIGRRSGPGPASGREAKPLPLPTCAADRTACRGAVCLLRRAPSLEKCYTNTQRDQRSARAGRRRGGGGRVWLPVIRPARPGPQRSLAPYRATCTL